MAELNTGRLQVSNLTMWHCSISRGNLYGGTTREFQHLLFLSSIGKETQQWRLLSLVSFSGKYLQRARSGQWDMSRSEVVTPRQVSSTDEVFPSFFWFILLLPSSQTAWLQQPCRYMRRPRKWKSQTVEQKDEQSLGPWYHLLQWINVT